MSSPNTDLPAGREVCLLCNLSTFTVLSIQSLSPSTRIPTNNFSFMRNKNHRWLTIKEFRQTFGEQASSRLSAYSPYRTIDSLERMNK